MTPHEIEERITLAARAMARKAAAIEETRKDMMKAWREGDLDRLEAIGPLSRKEAEELRTLWNASHPHFGGASHRYEGGACIYCCRPEGYESKESP